MFEKIYKNYRFFISLSIVLFSLILNVNYSYGKFLEDSVTGGAGMGGQDEAFRKTSGFELSGARTMGEIVAVVIQAFLGLLGIIFLVLMITAGYKWMTASGNEEKLTEAKETIWRAVIGLIIVVAAYAITYFVFNSLDWFGGGEAGRPL